MSYGSDTEGGAAEGVGGDTGGNYGADSSGDNWASSNYDYSLSSAPSLDFSGIGLSPSESSYGFMGANEADYNNPAKAEEFTPKYLHDGIRQFLEDEEMDIPLIIGGDVSYGQDIQEMYDIGYDGFTQGTRSLLTRTPDRDDPTIVHGLPKNILEDYYLNPAYHAVVSPMSPTRYESRHLDCLPDRTGVSMADRWRRCVSCVKDPDPKAKCGYLAGTSPVCFEQDLMEVHSGKPGIFFVGSSIDTIRKDAIYHNPDGSIRVPTFEEMLQWLMDPNGGYYRRKEKEAPAG